MRRLRLAIVGFGTVGRWLASAVERRRAWLEGDCGVDLSIVSVATRRGGFIHRAEGFDVPALLDGSALAGGPGTHRWASALEGLAATGCDVLAEASNTDPRQAEPALSHIRHALEHGAHVVTSSKGACACSAVALAELARRRGVALRMESTVMSGTPVLSSLREGLAGARILALRGILNGTANHILTRMAEGLDYAAALADAHARGYAEPDPADDVQGHDVVAKARILAAVAFGQAVPLDRVMRRGIDGIGGEAVRQAVAGGCRVRLVAQVTPVEVWVEPVALPLSDPLARIEGVMNALAIETDVVREVIIIGPGAGREQAGQGMFADLLAVVRGA